MNGSLSRDHVTVREGNAVPLLGEVLVRIHVVNGKHKSSIVKSVEQSCFNFNALRCIQFSELYTIDLLDATKFRFYD